MHEANLATIPPGVDGQARLEELRTRIAGAGGPRRDTADSSRSYLTSDQMLVRFLIARRWDVDKATDMLQSHYRWREERDLEALMNDSFPEAGAAAEPPDTGVEVADGDGTATAEPWTMPSDDDELDLDAEPAALPSGR
eukprot:NODE_18127_length_909_cov_2.742967.p2 GENE.NODE_18127_length_909_cov_2.742967~~NODE_18127_length_909_cov_2.742967.p2  ORF type:complete len:139 (-),score=45.02 NODE_18127_length_909_cov_2.742967:187-603(-)